MKIPYRWIREFVDVELSADAAADRLVNAGLEIASVTPVAPGLSGIVAAEIVAVEQDLGESHGHRLWLCRVSTGRERYSVVCGAPNTAVGLRAPWAPPGATLPGHGGDAPRKIGVATLRGVESQGMLCSERELGIGDAHETGVLALPASIAPGTDLLAHLGLDDSVLDVEITPNRPDCLSVVGVARELSALTGAAFHEPRIELPESDEPVTSLAHVRIEAPDLCPRFTARVISDVKLGPSPLWLALRLRAAGLRPISNVVDITNYVMWELGQPLHAFDHRSVSEASIVVRRARSGERITTLDGQERLLDPSMLLIADPRHGIGIAGVMGAAATEVTASTSRVLLESAYFLPASVRRTSRALGLRTDAAYRFERGADIEGVPVASARAAQLMAELAGGRVARGVLDVYPEPRPRPRVTLRMSRMRRVVGVAPPVEDARRILERLRLPVHANDAGSVEVEVPSFRRDLAMEDDLVEELIRVWGYDKIPSTLPSGAMQLVRQPDTFVRATVARRALIGAGLSEAVTPSFTDPARAGAFGARAPITLLNPLSQEGLLLRAHPLDGILGAVAANLRRQQPSVRLFEIARTYERHDGGTREPRWVAIALAGRRSTPSWFGSRDAVDVSDAKGVAELVLTAFRVDYRTGEGSLAGFEPDVHGALVAGDGVIVAEFGEVASSVRERFGLDAPVFAALVALDAIGVVPEIPRRYEPLPRFPAIQRDVAFVIEDPRVSAADVEREIQAIGGPLLRAVAIFDVFRLDDGRRSVAWRLTFRADDRTLTDEEVSAIHERIVRHLSGRFAITLRSGGDAAPRERDTG
ncbi:MAG: phenylalanine--tRNA ligase subunit beta [Candidatus Rokuibacteriota bacterium]|nr:MAG: phenylalanine--tRNA ligase subunit beta [Candidatus Rokubacteria bacterium]